MATLNFKEIQLNVETVLLQTIQFSINKDFVYSQLNDETVLFQTIQFCMLAMLSGSQYCYVSLKLYLNISHLFKHS